jgi:2-polyprenyl-3-methyl-5-hydroxy-6-metoxy-1,4-benzoquinol methylase
MSRDYNKEFKDNTNRKYQYEIDVFVRERFLARISAYFPQPNRSNVLEIGSFDGSMTNLLLRYFKQLDVVKPSSELARFVSGRFQDQVQIHNSTIEDFTTAKRYDHIFLIHTLEHLNDPVDTLKKLRNLLTLQEKSISWCRTQVHYRDESLLEWA